MCLYLFALTSRHHSIRTGCSYVGHSNTELRLCFSYVLRRLCSREIHFRFKWKSVCQIFACIIHWCDSKVKRQHFASAHFMCWFFSALETALLIWDLFYTDIKSVFFFSFDCSLCTDCWCWFLFRLFFLLFFRLIPISHTLSTSMTKLQAHLANPIHSCTRKISTNTILGLFPSIQIALNCNLLHFNTITKIKVEHTNRNMNSIFIRT